MSDDEGTAEHRPARRRADTAGNDDLARALGTLLGLSPAAQPAVPPVAAQPALRIPSTPLRPLTSAPDTTRTTDDSFWGDSPADAHPSNPDADAEVAAAFAESGFGGPLHTALGELRRISDNDVVDGGAPEKAAAFATPPSDPPDRYIEPVLQAPPSLKVGAVAQFSALSEWWAARRRELLPGMMVAALVIVAFAVVLISGGKGADSSRVGSGRSVPLDPSTTIPGLFATAGIPPADAPPGTDAPLGGGQSQLVAPATTKANTNGSADRPPSSVASRPESPVPTSPQTSPSPTSPPQTSPPQTSPPQTSPPTTEPPITSPPTTPATRPDLCTVRPDRC